MAVQLWCRCGGDRFIEVNRYTIDGATMEWTDDWPQTIKCTKCGKLYSRTPGGVFAVVEGQ